MRLPTATVTSLEIEADREVAGVLATCSGPPAKAEPDVVAEIIWSGVPAIASAWKPYLHAVGCSLTMHGVFCHARPRVTSSAGNCELADLLLVADFKQGGATQRSAILVQAKIASAGHVAIASGGPSIQLALYSGWPQFRITEKGYDNVRWRNFTAALGSAKVIEAGRYGGIDVTPGGEDWRQLDPSAALTMSTGVKLGSWFARMVDGQSGYGSAATLVGPFSDDWSFTIDELLRVTYHRAHAAMKRAGGAGARGVTALALLGNGAAGSVWALRMGATGGGPPHEAAGDDEPRGISVVHAIVERG